MNPLANIFKIFSSGSESVAENPYAAPQSGLSGNESAEPIAQAVNKAKEFADVSLKAGYSLQSVANGRLVELTNSSDIPNDGVVIASRKGTLDNGQQGFHVSMIVGGVTQTSDQKDKLLTLNLPAGGNIRLTKEGNVVINGMSFDPTVSARALNESLARSA